MVVLVVLVVLVVVMVMIMVANMVMSITWVRKGLVLILSYRLYLVNCRTRKPALSVRKALV